MPKRGSELLIAHLLPQNIPTHLLAHSLAKTSTAGPSMCYLGHARTQTLWYPGGQRCCQHTHHLSLAATPLPLLSNIWKAEGCGPLFRRFGYNLIHPGLLQAGRRFRVREWY